MIVSLDWDSAFFGRKVGRVDLVQGALPEQAALNNYDLIYFFAAPDDGAANDFAKKNAAKLVDEKVIYKKGVGAIGELDDAHIVSYQRRNDPNDDIVINIGLQSGIYSRFAVDKNFPPADFQKLYSIWMNRSIDRQIASDVLVYQELDVPYGVLTLDEKDGNADIGILAVDQKARGKQIGRKLVARAEAISYENNYDVLQVVTQKENQSACRFYEACGFKVDSVNNIYHWWKK